MLVGVLTIERKNDIKGQYIQPAWRFYPRMNQDFNWTISKNEIDACNNPYLEWVKTLPLVDFVEITQYEFLQFLDYSDAQIKLEQINNCFGVMVQPEPYRIYDITTRELIGYAIITNEDVKSCLSEIELNYIMTASTSDILITIE